MSLTDLIPYTLGSNFWARYIADEIQQELSQFYPKFPIPKPEFDLVYVSQADEGDIDKNILSSSVSRYWYLTADRKGPCEEKPKFEQVWCTLDSPGVFYKRPRILFYLDGSRILWHEDYGPIWGLRKHAQIDFANSKCTLLDIKTTFAIFQ